MIYGIKRRVELEKKSIIKKKESYINANDVGG